RRAENAQEEQNLLNKELQEKLGRKAPEAELVDTIDRIRQAEQREREARDEARAVTDRLRQAQAELAGLEAEQRAARREAERARRDAEASRREVDRLSNPFAPENLVEWAARHLPRVGLILLAIVVLRFLARSVSFRLVRVMARNSGARSTEQDQENRARTLTGIFRSFSSVLIVGGGALLIMDEFGVPVVPLLGGAAVLGLAVAFGAQNLIKDYFSGFMVLLEDQYGINDVVKIGSIAGQVEKITMRVTVLRDLDGVVHFIPHGQITTVSNLTHGWSRACFDIPVAHKEDPDRVMEVLLELAKEMRYDKQFGVLILDEPEMLGVDRFAESAVVIRFLIKTCPLQQWKVKRELLRRIKRRFDELGIEIPFPHRTVYHRHLPEPGAAAGEGEEAARAA
ncbi:MAG TPA: mechanosensitive ion channel domain-containing protein, partial [Gemmataceae bacterium]